MMEKAEGHHPVTLLQYDAMRVAVTLASVFLGTTWPLILASAYFDDRGEENGRRMQEGAETTRTTGVFYVMVLRIVALDSEPTVSAEDLYNLTFVDEISLKKQLFRCSFGQLDVQPKYGVLDVPVALTAVGRARGELIQEAYRVAPTLVQENVQDVRFIVDAVMLVVPPGTGDSAWAAFGTVRGQQSVYNDVWASYVGAAIHEVSHNLGLYHANENGVEYADQTGYMGSALMERGSPQKCFNGQNHWTLGWFSDRSLVVEMSNLLAAPQLVTLAAFVDYDKLASNDDDRLILVRIGDLYMQFNRAKGFNKDTSEKINQLTVVQEVFKGTELLAGLDDTSNNAIFSTVLDGSRLTIQVCRMDIHENNEALVDEVIVGIGVVPFPCSGAFSSPPPSPQPAVIAPDPIPTVFFHPPPPALRPSTLQPSSIAPTPEPTTAPISVAPTPDPTTAPLSIAPAPKPTATPTWMLPTSIAPTPEPKASPTAAPSPAIGRTNIPTFIVEDDGDSFGSNSLSGDDRSSSGGGSVALAVVLPVVVLISILLLWVAVIRYRRHGKRGGIDRGDSPSVITGIDQQEIECKLDSMGHCEATILNQSSVSLSSNTTEDEKDTKDDPY